MPILKSWKVGALAVLVVLGGIGAREATQFYREYRVMRDAGDLLSKECSGKPNCFVMPKGY